ncbi:MAG: response regulator transcription factor [Dehalococcoidales bacterium]|nr:response regulator transcription factor [Dehalococcoidales bacterium]
MRILVIEDEEPIAEIISNTLSMEGYAVDTVSNGEEGEKLAEEVPFDLIVLDLILPGKGGIEVCRSLRRRKVKTPIIMVTCKNSVEDKAMGLDSGADDYMGKPFSLVELLARVRALLRRDKSVTSSRIQIGDLTVDLAGRQVSRGKKVIDLTAKELALLEYLVYNPNNIITRRMIEQHVWNSELDSESNLVDVYISRLRAKLEEGPQKDLIQTIKGIGYRLRTNI